MPLGACLGGQECHFTPVPLFAREPLPFSPGLLAVAQGNDGSSKQVKLDLRKKLK